jgi:hypothetical protein
MKAWQVVTAGDLAWGASMIWLVLKAKGYA